MPRITPIPENEATDKVAQTYERVRDMFEGAAVPPPFLAFGRVPAFLQDFYMNFKKFVWTDGHIDARTKGLIALAVASGARTPHWADFFESRVRQLGSGDQEIADALAIAATCRMYNVFFKFRDLSGSDMFSGMGVGLRAHTFANTSLDAGLVELINIAISDINGCKPCTSGHVEKARQLGLTDDAILECVQCAAVVTAGCTFLDSAG
jgi:lipoyl-dependent peroxiredoxin subunit D